MCYSIVRSLSSQLCLLMSQQFMDRQNIHIVKLANGQRSLQLQQDATQQQGNIRLTGTSLTGWASSHVCTTNKETEACLSGLEGNALLLLQAQHILHQETVCIVPRQEDVLHNCEDALLLEAQSLPSHHRGVDQVKTQCISAILVQ